MPDSLIDTFPIKLSSNEEDWLVRLAVARLGCLSCADVDVGGTFLKALCRKGMAVAQSVGGVHVGWEITPAGRARATLIY